MAECPTCGGIGVVCIDDICVALGECMHGDGTCPTCGGEPYEDDRLDDLEDEDPDYEAWLVWDDNKREGRDG